MDVRVLAAFLFLLSVAPIAAQAPSPEPTYKDFERHPEVLSDAELERLKTAVMSRCHVPEGTDLAKAPWYFHYELGLALEKRGDAQRALDAFIEALQRRSDPQQGTRMYGVWFIDYLPYFQIAKAHAELGNWACAADALRLSEQAREVSPADRNYQLILELRQEIEGARKP
jgi:tetratricopeptide (TPR) repeat protein